MFVKVGTTRVFLNELAGYSPAEPPGEGYQIELLFRWNQSLTKIRFQEKSDRDKALATLDAGVNAYEKWKNDNVLKKKKERGDLERVIFFTNTEVSMSMSAYTKPEGVPGGSWVAPPMDQHTKGYVEAMHMVKQHVEKLLAFSERKENGNS